MSQNPFQSPTLKIEQGLFFHNHHLSLDTFNIRDHLEEMSLLEKLFGHTVLSFRHKTNERSNLTFI